MSSDLRELIKRAADAVDFDAQGFLACKDGNFSDELQSQYAVYLYSCAVSNALKRMRIHTDYAAGYSMGLYAALCHVESITFEQGLDLITQAFLLIRSIAAPLEFGVGVISGLTPADVRALMKGYADVEIININNVHNLLVAGYEKSVKALLVRAREQGALNNKYLTFHSPYHSRFMDGAAEEFREYCSSITIYDPACPVLSTVDQRVMTSWQDIAADLVDNINKNINWLETVNRMTAYGVNVFIETGPGKSLCRMTKFIDGDFTTYHLQNLQDFLATGRICVPAEMTRQ